MRPKLGVGVAKDPDPGEKFFTWGTFGQAEWCGRVASYMWAARYGGSASPPRSCVFGRFGRVEEVPISWQSRFKPSSLFSLGCNILRERHSGRAFGVVFSHLRYSMYRSGKRHDVNFLFGFPQRIAGFSVPPPLGDTLLGDERVPVPVGYLIVESGQQTLLKRCLSMSSSKMPMPHAPWEKPSSGILKSVATA
jgi:hypothetical protein